MTREELTARNRSTSRRRRTPRGAAAVEFALVLPLLLAIVFGVITFGFLMAQKAALSNASRAAARFGTVNAYTGASAHTCQAVIDKARAGAGTLGISDADKTKIAVTVTFTDMTTNAARTVCAAAAGSTTAGTGTGTASPCQNPTGTPATPDQLTVALSYVSPLLVPAPGLGSTTTLNASSSFVCEYYQ